MWRFVQGTDIVCPADVPDELRVVPDADLAGRDLFTAADGGAAVPTTAIDLQADGEDGGAELAALMPCTAAFMAVCF